MMKTGTQRFHFLPRGTRLADRRQRARDIARASAANRRTIIAAVYPPDNHVGGCNFCNRHFHSFGETPHAVVQLSGDGLLARLCQQCAEAILPTLQQFVGNNR